MIATCANGHEVDLGDVPLDQGPVWWECPDCQAKAPAPGTEAPIEAPEPDLPEGSTHVTDGDLGTGTSPQ